MTSNSVFGDFAKIESGYAFKSSEWLSSGMPVVKIKNIKDGIIMLEDCAFVSEKTARRAKDFAAQGGDILISLTGYVGQVGRVLPRDYVLVNQRVGFVRPDHPHETDYIYYLLRFLRPQIEELGTGTAQANVAPKDIMKLSIPVIPKESRAVVGNLLNNLDKRIGANNDLSKTLEDIAQTIFKSWFIDFDAVKAKMAGEKPVGMDAATAALFPDSMEESELGLVPKGWDVKPAADLFQVGIGRTPPRKEPQWFCQGTEGIPWVSIRDMGTFETYSHGTNEGLTQAAVDKFKVPVVPENTVLMSFKLTVGKLCISDTDLVTNEAIAHFKISEDSPLNTLYTYLWLSNLDMGSLDSTSSIGTATNSGVIKQIKFLVPPQELLGIFHNKVSPIFSQLKLLRKQTTNLVLLRDSLLPRLISGELQIPEEMLVL
jgi:type I restriction enzyme S subunit